MSKTRACMKSVWAEYMQQRVYTLIENNDSVFDIKLKTIFCKHFLFFLLRTYLIRINNHTLFNFNL